MDHLTSLIVFCLATMGGLLACLLAWQALVAVLRLATAARTPAALGLLLERLAESTRLRQPWEPALRALRLELPWPWPWRLGRAADRLAAGEAAEEVLATTGLLPAALRAQAAQALRQGPDIFRHWCLAVGRQGPTSAMAVRQGALLLTELAVALAIIHYLVTVILPKYAMIFIELGMEPPVLLVILGRLTPWELPILAILVATGSLAFAGMIAWRWRRRRRQAAARLLLAGAAARLPEPALGDGGSFERLCVDAGWHATTPTGLARILARDELRTEIRAAWLPALAATAAPMATAIPIGLLVIGIMQMLLSVLIQIEAQP